ncbi:hypothetical protein ACMU_09955 [Actibacterium mucosum KCTC 23349]|uniref:DUF2155 domain-containing protein n=1 Tax=Actibacterium mucosum KCTC 23349 TaxID=1454373 RepID=A0A037ZKJ0_9RHOB|nr:hypothetical protein ACMU_09955 [Actibacterium mucosum KCTC 23349]
MLRALAACAAALAAVPAVAQDSRVLTESAPGAVIRVLDRVTGNLVDLDMGNGQSAEYGRVRIGVNGCRFPADNPASDAFAFLSIEDMIDPTIRFEGWMVASSPALNALDHPRYDVWVLRCISN